MCAFFCTRFCCPKSPPSSSSLIVWCFFAVFAATTPRFNNAFNGRVNECLQWRCWSEIKRYHRLPPKQQPNHSISTRTVAHKMMILYVAKRACQPKKRTCKYHQTERVKATREEREQSTPTPLPPQYVSPGKW